MAAWQADFYFSLVASQLPRDYKERLSAVLPAGHSWSPAIEIWGSEDSDRIDVTQERGVPPEVLCRFDLREWKPDLYQRFVALLQGIGGELRTADGEIVNLKIRDFEEALRSSAATRFVANPEQFLKNLSQ